MEVRSARRMVRSTSPDSERKTPFPDGKYGDLSAVELTLTCRLSADVILTMVRPVALLRNGRSSSP